MTILSNGPPRTHARDRVIASLAGFHVLDTSITVLRFRGQMCGAFACNSCVAKIPVRDPDDALCTACGSIVHECARDCEYCGEPVFLSFAGDSVGGVLSSPYFRCGLLKRISSLKQQPILSGCQLTVPRDHLRPANPWPARED